jgi:hypothetical protein
MTWETVAVSKVGPGDRIRHRGTEFTVARVDPKFLGRDEMVCFIEDTPDRWHAYPARLVDQVEIQRNAPAT